MIIVANNERRQCQHRHNLPLIQTLLYCFALSSIFVLSLYVFVPHSVRRLPRDHVLHIKWRGGIILGVMLLGMGCYPMLFCLHHADVEDKHVPSWFEYVGISWQPWQDLRVAMHVVTLYAGSLTCAWLKLYRNSQNDVIHREDYSRGLIRRTIIQPFQTFLIDESYRWTTLRNLAIAPLAEEVIFRACLVPPLLASRISGFESLSPTQVSWIAPLFFGVAHLHHFYEKYRQTHPSRRSRKVINQLLLGLAVQWTYTTLFGAYVSHVFIRTCSLSGVTLAHVICNFLGLPDVTFAHPTSNLHGYRWFISIVYVLGIGVFVVGFNSVLFPSESKLPFLLSHGS